MWGEGVRVAQRVEGRTHRWSEDNADTFQRELSHPRIRLNSLSLAHSRSIPFLISSMKPEGNKPLEYVDAHGEKKS